MAKTIFEQCSYETEGSDSDVLLKCIADTLDAQAASDADSMLQWLLVLCGALIFFMQVGLRSQVTEKKKYPKGRKIQNDELLKTEPEAHCHFFPARFCFSMLLSFTGRFRHVVCRLCA